MIPHLPRPARSRTSATARTLRRLKTAADTVIPERVKRPKRQTQAFNAAKLMTPPMIATNAASSSD